MTLQALISVNGPPLTDTFTSQVVYHTHSSENYGLKASYNSYALQT